MATERRIFRWARKKYYLDLSLSVRYSTIRASEVDEGEALRVIGSHDFADENRVIARVHHLGSEAFEGGQHSGQDGYTGSAEMPIQALEAVLRLL